MALQQIKFAPGIDKQDTSVGAVGRWVDSDNVRFRYGLPEKVGGWQSLLTDSIVGVARKQHAFVDTEGNRYIAIRRFTLSNWRYYQSIRNFFINSEYLFFFKFKFKNKYFISNLNSNYDSFFNFLSSRFTNAY